MKTFTVESNEMVIEKILHSIQPVSIIYCLFMEKKPILPIYSGW